MLLVEDDPKVRAAIYMLLADAGYGVIGASSVKTALMHLDVLDLTCVVLDLHLPNGHGRRVVEELQAKRDDVPVVILSSFHDSEGWEFPVVSVLEKPVKKEALIKCVDNAAKHADAIHSLRETTRRMQDITGIV